MSFDLKKILESKRAFRRDLAALPVAEKLRMLDAMRERELLLRGGTDRFPAPADGSAPEAANPVGGPAVASQDS